MEKKDRANHFVTGRVRLSYVSLNQPRAPLDGGEPKYSVTVLLPKSDTTTKQIIDTAVQAAMQAGINKQWNGVKPPNLTTPLHDGDGVRESGVPFGPECKGCWVFTATAKQDRKPRIVNANVQDILDPAEIYSGMYGRVGVDAYPYNHKVKRGIAFGLTNVQKLADGEPLANITTAEDDFGTPVDNAGVNPLTGLPF